MIRKVYLNLGSSIRPKTNISRAEKEINLLMGVSVVSMSRVYTSRAIGIRSYRNFYNASLLIETRLSIHDLKKASKGIELAFGRSVKKSASIKDRPIDIDIITYEGINLDINSLQPYELIPLFNRHYKGKRPFRRSLSKPLDQGSPWSVL